MHWKQLGIITKGEKFAHATWSRKGQCFEIIRLEEDLYVFRLLDYKTKEPLENWSFKTEAEIENLIIP